jgi:hypothetical protein
MANSVINEDTDASFEYFHLINDASTFTIWNEAASNEFGRLAQGVDERIDGLNTILFIPRQAVPKGEKMLPTDGSSSTSVSTNLKSTVSASL